jgi:hypothetical protein
MSIDSSRAGVGKRLLDRLALLGASLLFIAVGGGVFLWADKHHINDAWVFAGSASLTFLGIVGWPFRSKFRLPNFVAFFVAWLLLHVAIFLLVLGYLGFLYYVPIVVLELWIGYTLAIWPFGPPPDRPLR